MTVSDLIKGSMRLLGATASGETPTASELADGLAALIDMMDSWSSDGFMLFSRTIESLTLTASTSSYTIGTGGTLNTGRPERIIEANIKQAGDDAEMPIAVVNSGDWNRISDKTVTSDFPTAIYYNPTFPLGTLLVWPVPTAAAVLVLTSDKPLTAFSATSDTVSLPPGYARALRYNLAMELAPEYGISVSNEIASIANDSKSQIMRVNTTPLYMESDVLSLSRKSAFNWRTGE